MARVFSEDQSWDLAAFAESYLRGYPQVRPRAAGRACEEFIRAFPEFLGRDVFPEAAVRHAEDQVATAYISLVTIPGRRLRSPRVELRVHGWPIIVVHGEPGSEQYAVLFEISDWTRWDDTTRPLVGEYPGLSFDSDDYVRNLLSVRDVGAPQTSGEYINLLARAVVELSQVWKVIPSILIPRLGRRLNAGQPNPALGVNVPGGSASVGVVGASNGQAVATTVAHVVGQNGTVQVFGNTCNVLHVDFVQDAAKFDASHLSIASRTLRGPLIGLAPAGGVTHDFIGAKSGAGSDPVIAWDAAIPWVSPTLPVQSHVYTGCVTQPGDSGAALISPAGRVIGFAQFSVPSASHSGPYTSASPGLSGWVWAEGVFSSLSIT